MPDGKAQVTVEYEDGKAKRIKTIVVSVQHSKKKPFEELENEIRNEVLPIALSVFPADEDTVTLTLLTFLGRKPMRCQNW